MHKAYFLTPLLILPLVLVWRLAWKSGSPGLLMVAFQFSVMAAFEILVDCSYVLVTQDSLVDNAYSESYLTHSFFASVVQYNVFALVLWWFVSKRREAFTESAEGLNNREVNFVSFIVILAGCLTLYTLYFQGLTLTYGNAVKGESIEGSAGEWGPIAFLVQLGTIYAVFILIKGFQGKVIWRIAYVCSAFLTVMFTLKLLTGARAAVFTLALYALSAVILLRKNVRRYAIAASLPIGFFLIIFGAFSSERLTGQKASLDEAFDRIFYGVKTQVGGESSLVAMAGRSAHDFAWRSGGARMGAVLFADVDTQGTVGLRSVLDNLASGIPRSIWNSRPYGNSRDGTAAGLATYQVSVMVTGSNLNQQSDSVSSASVAYWCLGWFGVVLSGAVSALIIAGVLSSSWLNRGTFPAVLLLAFTLGGWMVLSDLGTWLNLLSRQGVFLLAVGLVTGVILPGRFRGQAKRSRRLMPLHPRLLKLRQ
jgi:hypothetical protein